MSRPLVDEADWSDIELKSCHSGGTLRYNGYGYVTEGERQLAILLTKIGIPFTPEVRFALSGTGLIYVPDFIFDFKAYIWLGESKKPEVVHGIEVKAASLGFFSARGTRKVEVLREHRRVNVIMLSHKQIDEFTQQGFLPLTPFLAGIEPGDDGP